MPAIVQGTLSANADANYFQFQAVAGQQYDFQNVLGSLADSVFTLLGSDGKTVLAQNYGLAPGTRDSQITWQAPTSGTFYLATTAFPNAGFGSYLLELSTTGRPARARGRGQSELDARRLALGRSVGPRPGPKPAQL